MGNYSVTANKGSASVQTVMMLGAAASNPRRARIYDLTFGCDAAPADNTFVIIGQRCTTAGTGASLTPNATDPADTIASTIIAKDTITADPTLTAAAFPFPGFALNQRASFRWVAPPGGELVIPATASNGIAFGLKTASTTSFQFGGSFAEQ